ncbi:MAG: hypothetical protein NC311_11980 [Muribaculaceae bacterium]|nr:hypothetical protein [Muribaculaceae bacterium]
MCEKMNPEIRQLEKFDSGTVGNCVAGYPSREAYCLRLYDAWGEWYTSSEVKNLFPHLGTRVGYAVTCVMGEEAEGDTLSINDVIRAIDRSPKPVIVVMKAAFQPEHARRAAIFGGNVATAFKRVGAVGYITDGQIRDYAEIDALEMPCIAEGMTPGHGNICIKEVQSRVEIAGMSVAPGDIIHMDQSGAVKVPPRHFEEVLTRAESLAAHEERYQQRMREAENAEALIAVRSKKAPGTLQQR